MRSLKKENGVITVLTLVTILFMVSFLLSTYIIISNKVRTQKEMLDETRKIYESDESMEEIYDSYMNSSNIIPIYTAEQLLAIGTDEKDVNINGKYYNFNNNENTIYALMNDLKFTASDYNDKLTDDGYWTPIGDNETLVAKFEGNGHKIEVIYGNKNKIYDKNNNYSDKIPEYSKANRNNDGTLAQNARWTDTTGTAVIPAGFKVVDGIGGTGDQKVGNGLVIQDSSGNEFVWIPVTFTKGEGEQPDETTGLYPSFLNVFKRSNWDAYERSSTALDSTYTEPYSSGYSTEAEEYNNMMKSVQNNGGFYIGRYEAGSVEKENPSTGKPRTNTANGTTGVVVKKDQYPYNYVGWGSSMNEIDSDITYSVKDQGKGAVYLSKHFYDNKDVGVVSTLCYSIQWDAMLEFLNKDGSNKFNLKGSTEWGNHSNSTWTIENENASYCYFGTGTWKAFSSDSSNTKSKTNSEDILLTTGASNEFVAKNIYDIAGNCSEWTMEADSSSYRVWRGR